MKPQLSIICYFWPKKKYNQKYKCDIKIFTVQTVSYIFWVVKYNKPLLVLTYNRINIKTSMSFLLLEILFAGSVKLTISIKLSFTALTAEQTVEEIKRSKSIFNVPCGRIGLLQR